MESESGLSDSPTAASFIRPRRASDKPLTFLSALSKKYGSLENHDAISSSEEQINISGKTVEEVGFEKIRQQQATLQELRIVSLDGLCIGNSGNENDKNAMDEWHRIRSKGLKIVDLDLSRNLLERWSDVTCICSVLRPTLRSLSLK